MPRFEFEGRTPAEAAIRACEELGLTRSELRYDVVSDTGEGIDRRVVIAVEAAEKRERPVEAEAAEAPAREGRERRESRGRERGGRERGGRGRERGGRERNGRDRDRGRARREPVAREADDGIEALLKLDEPPTQAIPERPTVEQPSEKAVQSRNTLAEMLRLMGWQANVRIVQDDAEEIHLDVGGADANRVVGKKGEPLLSLQFLVNRLVSNDGEGEQVIVIDVSGYRERRRQALADLARRLAARAVEEKKVVKLSPMSAHDRRVFHLTLTEMQGVTTRSEGDGLYRRLLIIPSEYAQP